MSSFALSDIIIGEPGAKIGYSSYRKLRNKNPDESKRSIHFRRFLKKGFVDLVINREDLKYQISTLIGYFKTKIFL